MHEDLALPQAAQQYAADGCRVFPLKPRGKTPLVKAWDQVATTEGYQVEAWWAKWPDANIGWALPSTVFVIDVDARHGGNLTWETLEDEHGEILTEWVATDAGGFHLYLFGHHRNGKLAPGVDIKGEGGYVVLPPSIHPSGHVYRWGDPGRGFRTSPRWIEDLLAPAEPKPRLTPAPRPTRTSRYVAKAVQNELEALTGAPEGDRNNQLNRTAHALYRFVADGDLDGGWLARELQAVGESTGMSASEVRKTIASARKARGA